MTTEAALQLSEERFRSLALGSPIGIFVTDGEGRCQFTNPRCQAICGFTFEEALGDGWARFVHEKDRPAMWPSWQREAAAGREFSGRFRFVHRDGTVRWTLVRTVPIPGPGGEVAGHVGTVEDVTERREAELALRERARLSGFGADVVNALAAAGTLREILQGCAESIVEHLGAAFARIWTLEEPGDVLRLRASAGMYTHLDGAHSAVRVGQLKIGLIARERRPHLTNSVIGDPRVSEQDWARENGMRAFAGYPLLVEDRLVGVMAMFARHPLSEFTLQALASVANSIAVGIDRKRAEESVERSERRFRALIENSSDAVALVDAEGTIVYASPSTERVLGFRDEEYTGRNAFDFVHPDDAEAAARILAAVLADPATPVTVQVRHRHRDGGWRWLEATAVNLLHEPAVGAIVSNYRDITEQRRAAEELTASLEAERVAREAADRANTRLRFLLHASSEAASSLDSGEMLQGLARRVAAEVADWCFIDLRENDGSIRRAAVGHAHPEDADAARTLHDRYPPDPAGGHPSARVIRSGRAELVEELTPEAVATSSRDEEHARLVSGLGWLSYVTVPLGGRSGVIGTLTLVSTRRSGRRFGPDDLALAEDLARRAATMLDNARLYETQREVASTLQRSLLPSSLPEVPGVEIAVRFHPAGRGIEVGGDFYDVFDLGPGRWGVAVGDVCGKGSEAAAVSGLARHTIRAAAISAGSPTAVLDLLNEMILRSSAERFCTAIYGELTVDAGGAHFRYARGGHPLPLVLRRSGEVETVGSPGTLVGVFDRLGTADREITLERGDALLLYTDGLVESNRDAGLPWLREVLAGCAGSDADGIAARVENAAVASGPADREDDVAMIVLRSRPETEGEP